MRNNTMSNGNHLPDKPAENESRLDQEQGEHINEGLGSFSDQ